MIFLFISALVFGPCSFIFHFSLFRRGSSHPLCSFLKNPISTFHYSFPLQIFFFSREMRLPPSVRLSVRPSSTRFSKTANSSKLNKIQHDIRSYFRVWRVLSFQRLYSINYTSKTTNVDRVKGDWQIKSMEGTVYFTYDLSKFVFDSLSWRTRHPSPDGLEVTYLYRLMLQLFISFFPGLQDCTCI